MLRSDPGLSGAGFRRDGIAVLGAVGYIVPDSAEGTLTREWDRAFAEYRSDLAVDSWRSTIERLGADLREELLSSYRSWGNLDSALVFRARDALGDSTRYAAIARLITDEIGHDRTVLDASSNSVLENNVTLSTSRSAIFNGEIWDLVTGTPVWSATVEVNREKSEDQHDPAENEISSWGDLLGTVVQSIVLDDPKNPDAPKLRKLAREGFGKLVKKMPK